MADDNGVTRGFAARVAAPVLGLLTLLGAGMASQAPTSGDASLMNVREAVTPSAQPTVVKLSPSAGLPQKDIPRPSQVPQPSAQAVLQERKKRRRGEVMGNEPLQYREAAPDTTRSADIPWYVRRSGRGENQTPPQHLNGKHNGIPRTRSGPVH